MIDYERAIDIAQEYISSRNCTGTENILLLEETIVKKYGWFFFYQSKEYIESGDFSKMLLGNSPFLVDINGLIHKTGSSAYDITYYINKFDRQFDEK